MDYHIGVSRKSCATCEAIFSNYNPKCPSSSAIVYSNDSAEIGIETSA